MALSVQGPQAPSYTTRQDANLGVAAAGAAAQSQKFLTFAASRLFAVTSSLVTQGTSTYTTTVNGTGTARITGQQFSVIVIQNTATSGQTAQLSTQTYGPYLAGGNFSSAANGTQTGQVGGIDVNVLNALAGTAGYGGVLVAPGSIVYCVTGTDATASSAFTIDYQLDTSAGLTQ